MYTYARTHTHIYVYICMCRHVHSQARTCTNNLGLWVGCRSHGKAWAIKTLWIHLESFLVSPVASVTYAQTSYTPGYLIESPCLDARDKLLCLGTSNSTINPIHEPMQNPWKWKRRNNPWRGLKTNTRTHTHRQTQMHLMHPTDTNTERHKLRHTQTGKDTHKFAWLYCTIRLRFISLHHTTNAGVPAFPLVHCDSLQPWSQTLNVFCHELAAKGPMDFPAGRARKVRVHHWFRCESGTIGQFSSGWLGYLDWDEADEGCVFPFMQELLVDLTDWMKRFSVSWSRHGVWTWWFSSVHRIQDEVRWSAVSFRIPGHILLIS